MAKARAGIEQSIAFRKRTKILRLQNFSETFSWLFSKSCYYLLTYNEPLFSALLSIFYRGHIGPGSRAAKNCSTPKLFMIITFALRTRSSTNQRRKADGSTNRKAREWLIIHSRERWVEYNQDRPEVDFGIIFFWWWAEQEFWDFTRKEHWIISIFHLSQQDRNLIP